MLTKATVLFLLFFIHVSVESKDNLGPGIPSTNGQLVDRIGYVFLYSEKYEQPLWVSYKLTKAEIQNKGSATIADYKGPGYDRGHLAPAADMAWSNQSMSFFFLTNMSPRVPALNRGM